MTNFTEKLAVLRGRITQAAIAAGRASADVAIVAVSKTQSPQAIRAAHSAGLADFGENYVQEAVAKITQLEAGLAWHFIGALQANKTRAVAEHFQWVQTLTSTKLADRLSNQRPYYAGDLQICIQLQPQQPAAARGGVPEGELAALAAHVAGLPRLRLRGLMFMPLPELGAAALRAEFRRARQLFEALGRAGHALDTLSMGMSDDLEIAVEEGSTMVRVGTALFGARPSDGMAP